MKILRLPLSVSRPSHSARRRYHACFLLLGDHPPKASRRSRTLVSRCDPIRLMAWRQEALPASLETLFVALPCSRTPGGPPRQTIAALRHGPRNSYNEGSTINKHFGAQSHGFTTCCLRLKATSLPPTKARFRWVVNPFRAGWFPPGFNRVFQSLVRSTFSFRFMVSVYERHPRLSGLRLAPRKLVFIGSKLVFALMA
jgi:hypothetical protein